MMIQDKQHIAVVAGGGIGDGLIFMTLANQLVKNGKNVVFYNAAILDLAPWFPHVMIKAFPQKDKIMEEFSRFDWVIGQAHSILDDPSIYLDNSYVLKKKYLNREKSFVEALAEFSKNTLGLSDVDTNNGMIVQDKELIFRKYKRRVLIHPESHAEQKNWPPLKFMKFAEKIKSDGWDPVFIVSPLEGKKWEQIINHRFDMPVFSTLMELGRYMQESGCLVGNDSGIGHLASNIGIPTLSIFAFKGTSKFWRPGWKENYVVFPFIRNTSKAYRNRWWKNWLTVRRVYKNFIKLMLGR